MTTALLHQGWIDIGQILYKNGLVSLIIDQSTTQLLYRSIWDVTFSNYCNGLGFKQTYTGEHDMGKTYLLLMTSLSLLIVYLMLNKLYFLQPNSKDISKLVFFIFRAGRRVKYGNMLTSCWSAMAHYWWMEVQQNVPPQTLLQCTITA